MNGLIVKKDLSTEGLEDLFLFNTSEEKCLIKSDIPASECLDDSFMGRCASCSDKSRADGTFFAVFIADLGKFLETYKGDDVEKDLIELKNKYDLKLYKKRI